MACDAASDNRARDDAILETRRQLTYHLIECGKQAKPLCGRLPAAPEAATLAKDGEWQQASLN
jgi:hypothetical protein